MEENCRADLSHSERGVSVSDSVSASFEEIGVDAEAELQCSSDASLVCPLRRCREVCGEAEHEWAPLT